MPNANTVRQQVVGTIQLTLAPLSGTTITTTQTAFQLNNNAISLTGGGVIPLTAGVTGLYQGTGRVLTVAATGTISGATSGTTTLLLELWEVPASVVAAGLTATSFTGWNEVDATGAATITGTQASWQVNAYLQLDNAGNLEGTFEASINGAAFGSGSVAPVVITPVTGLTGEADLNFVMTATLGGAETGVIVTMTEFRIDLN